MSEKPAAARPFFSVIIPTTRPQYLQYSLASVMAQTFPDFEVIVAFNRGPGVPNVESLPDDPRIKFVEAPKFLIMYDNWENGFRHATGQWRMLLGDDDCLIPQALEIVAAALKRTPDAEMMMWRWGAFTTPGCLPEVMEGRAQLPSYSGRVYARTSDDVGRLLYGFDPDRMGEMKRWLPSVMRGAVRAEVVEAAWKRTGMFCMPLSPDYGGAAQIIALTQAVHLLDMPLVILNHTNDSMSAAIRGKTNTLVSHFYDLVDDPVFHHTIVQTRFGSNRPAVCETLMRVRDKYPELRDDIPFHIINFLEWHYSGLLESAKQGTDIAAALHELNQAIATLSESDRSDLQGRMVEREAVMSALPPAPGFISRVRWSIARIASRLTIGQSISARLAPRFGIDIVGKTPNSRSIIAFATFSGSVIDEFRRIGALA